MIIYFKDCSGNKDAEGKLYEYSLDEFEGGYDAELEIPDILTDNEIYGLLEERVCDLTSFKEIINNEVERVMLLMENLKRCAAFKVVNSKVKYVNMTVSMVNRGSFNDERLVSSLKINVDDIDGEPLVWTDLYLDKKDGNKIKIAPVYLENNELYYLKGDGKDITVVKKMGFSEYFSDDFDASHIIATELYCSCNS